MKFYNYLRASYQELVYKVSWPTSAQLAQSTAVVLGATIFITVLVGVMDFAIGFVMNKFYGIS
jgi:preprotein translocase subunit SecE